MKKFWDNKLQEAFKLKESGSKKLSDWQIINLIILKYGINIQIRGIGATEGAIRIVKDKDSWAKFDEKEKKFVSNLAGGG